MQSHLANLIKHTLPHLSPDEVEQKEVFEQYVLESTLGQQGSRGRGEDDWRSLVDELGRAVLRKPGGSSQDALRFSQLASQLRTQPIPRDKLAVLSLLLSLSDSNDPRGPSSSAQPARSFYTATSSSSLLPSLHDPRAASAFSRPTSTIPTSANSPTPPSFTPIPPNPSTTPATAPVPGNPPTARQTPKLSMAARLALHRAQTASATRFPPVPEQTLLRDIIYVLQGIDGQYVRFKAPPERVLGPRRPYVRGEIVVDDIGTDGIDAGLEIEEGIEFVLEGTGMSISAPTRVLLHTLAELGWLYRKIDKAIEVEVEVGGGGGGKGKGKGVRVVGMVEQSLHAALKGEMTEYFRLIAILEGQLEEGGERMPGENGDDAPLDGMDGGLTLRRLLVWTEDVRLRMRMMATLVEEVAEQGSVGGALLTSLHSRTSNGDPFIRDFSSRLLRTLSVPFFATLAAWIYEGELRDPFEEYFVELNPAIEAGERGGDRELGLGEVGEFGRRGEDEDEGVQAHELWEGKFGFRREMLPGFLEEAFGRKIFSTGKSLNFMKYSCQDSAWVVERNRSDGSSRTLQYADMAGLERSISLAYSVASQRLFDIFFDNFRLLDHLKALKDYLMLGKGDFVEILMEHLGPSLAKPANTLYRHNLTATLETAIRGSTSSSDHPDTLRRLDARMLDFTQGELGWDVFTLDYKVDAPLDTVLDPKSMEEYLKMFKHLWQIKRVEYSLNGVWRRLMTGARTFLRVPELAFLFHQTRLSLAEMIFFIRQIQYYCHLEVIGCSWQVLEDFALKKEGDLDSLIEAHRTYLKRLVTKALLTSTRRPSKRGGPETSMTMLEQVCKIFKSLLSYQEAADSLCNYALAEAGRQEGPRDVARGLVDDIPAAYGRYDPDAIVGIQNRLAEYSGDFKALAISLVVSLGQAPDLDMRFLSVRLNFNYAFVNPNKPEA